MRIAVATSFTYRAGGVESYLESVLPALLERGHEIGVWHEYDEPPGSERIVPASVQLSSLGRSTSDTDAALDAMARWHPDVIFLQGLTNVALELRLLPVAPLVTFLHAYNGTCISGTKLRLRPTPAPCTRPLGVGCLVQYLPRGCGGWSPVTMVTMYAMQRQRQGLLRSCAAVATLSEHMRNECVAQGVPSDRVVHLPAFVTSAGGSSVESGATHATAGPHEGRTWHLGFVGRLEQLKGARLLIEALARVSPALRRNLRTTIVGDGHERARCEEAASRMTRDGLDIRFAGWLPASEISAFFATLDLLVVPSIWPEPLGLVGLEAAAAGVPALAFDVGAIHEWLSDGVTGHLIREPASADALARGLDACLADPARLARWGAAAREGSLRRTVGPHASALELVLGQAAHLQPAKLSEAAVVHA